MATHTYDKEVTALLVIDPYNDFISEGGKLWDRIRAVAEANDCVPHMLQVFNAARNAKLRVFYAMHHRYRPGDYETWKYVAPVQKAAWARKSFESRHPNQEPDMSSTQVRSETAIETPRARSGRHEARGRRHPCFGRRSRQALLRRPGLEARRRLRQG